MGECILAGHPQGGKIGYGTYIGDSPDTEITAVRTIQLPVTPKWVLVTAEDGRTTDYEQNGFYYYGGLALAGSPAKTTTGTSVYSVEIVENGFKVRCYSYNRTRSNLSGTTYHYIYGT